MHRSANGEQVDAAPFTQVSGWPAALLRQLPTLGIEGKWKTPPGSPLPGATIARRNAALPMRPTTKSFRALTDFALLGTLAACSSAGSGVTEASTLRALDKKALPIGTVLDEKVTEPLPAGGYSI